MLGRFLELALVTGDPGSRWSELQQLGFAAATSGDIWTQFPLASCIDRLARDDVAHFVLVPNPDFHAQGDFGIENGRLLDRAPRHTYANIGVLRAEFFAGRQPGRFALAPLMFEWIRQDRVSGELYRGRWHNLGTPAQLAHLDAQLRAHDSSGG